jgi:hypothetical protein
LNNEIHDNKVHHTVRVQPSHKHPIRPVHASKKVSKGIQTEARRPLGMNDHLLTDLTDLQREYIIVELYPKLKQSILHVSAISLNFLFSSFTTQWRLTTTNTE